MWSIKSNVLRLPVNNNNNNDKNNHNHSHDDNDNCKMIIIIIMMKIIMKAPDLTTAIFNVAVHTARKIKIMMITI